MTSDQQEKQDRDLGWLIIILVFIITAVLSSIKLFTILAS